MTKPTTTNNPAQLGLTPAQDKVLGIVSMRVAAGKTVTTSDVAEAWGGKNRSYVYRVLESLIVKGLVTRYSQRYYSVA